MQKLLLIFILFVLKMIFVSTSFAEWIPVEKNNSTGTTFYIENENIRVDEGYVYFWRMDSREQPDDYGDLSYQVYYEGDCKKFRVKTLIYNYFKGKMGLGSSNSEESENKNWKYPSPGTVAAHMLKLVCEYTGK